jgi:hypothetical protein
MSAPDPVVSDVARDPLWFPYRYDPSHDAFQFRRLTREDHRGATFLTDEYLGPAGPPLAYRRADVMESAAPAAPLHFIFHSAFCCSTVLARAFDVEGVAMGLKEPLFFNDMFGWQMRGGAPEQLAAVMNDGLRLLARPFAQGETLVVKPSNIINGMAPLMLSMRSDAKALLLEAPLADFLNSIARKGMWGRLWARDLVLKQLRVGLHPFGFKPDDYFGQTDLQVAAMGWLAQHALFARLAAQLPGRVKTLDSVALMAAPERSMAALAGLFGVDLDVPAVVAGPAFTRHSKSGSEFGAAARVAEQEQAAPVHADEIGKVVVWAEAVAKAAGVPMQLPAGLIG